MMYRKAKVEIISIMLIIVNRMPSDKHKDNWKMEKENGQLKWNS